MSRSCTLTLRDIHPVVIIYPDKFTITLSPNGGTGNAKEYKRYKNDKFTFPECEFTAPEGHTFGGWSCNGTVYAAGSTITVSGDMDVAAQWQPKDHFVSFNTLGECAPPSTQAVKHGSTAVCPEVPYCYNGKYISGRYTDIDLSNKFSFDTAITDNITLFAKWCDISASIGTGLTNGDTYTVYYGDAVILKESAARINDPIWSVTVDGNYDILDVIAILSCI